jgi:hypothetical protein
MRQGLTHALEAGRLLNEAKGQVPHSGWREWLQEHCPDFPERLAQRYMQVARDLPDLLRGPNATRVSDLSFRQALTLLADNVTSAAMTPEVDRPEALDKAADATLNRRQVDVYELLRQKEEARRKRRAEGRRRGIEHWRERQREEDVRRAGLSGDQDGYDGYLEPPEFVTGRPVLPPKAEYGPDSENRLDGLGDWELTETLAALEDSYQWYCDLTVRLGQLYEPPVVNLARFVAAKINELADRLTYSRDELRRAVSGLRELLEAGAKSGKAVRRWARQERVSRGLLALAQRILCIVVRSHDDGESWSLPQRKGK